MSANPEERRLEIIRDRVKAGYAVERVDVRFLLDRLEAAERERDEKDALHRNLGGELIARVVAAESALADTLRDVDLILVGNPEHPDVHAARVRLLAALFTRPGEQETGPHPLSPARTGAGEQP